MKMKKAQFFSKKTAMRERMPWTEADIKHRMAHMMWWNFTLLKISIFAFGIMVAMLFPRITNVLPWYGWLMLAFVVAIIPYSKAWSSTNKKKVRKGVEEFNPKLIPKRVSTLIWWHFAFVKIAILLFAFAAVEFYPPMLSWLPWYIWGLIALISGIIFSSAYYEHDKSIMQKRHKEIVYYRTRCK
jgi:hypothetical protein